MVPLWTKIPFQLSHQQKLWNLGLYVPFAFSLNLANLHRLQSRLPWENLKIRRFPCYTEDDDEIRSDYHAILHLPLKTQAQVPLKRLRSPPCLYSFKAVSIMPVYITGPLPVTGCVCNSTLIRSVGTVTSAEQIPAPTPAIKICEYVSLVRLSL